ncbi:MAG TPA: hypothetical protein VK674_00955 [Candidatus Limnocylindria bacterium]|nr:hypothetical protein [Candidatus Limnocylindria bacterium]
MAKQVCLAKKLPNQTALYKFENPLVDLGLVIQTAAEAAWFGIFNSASR